jgi:CheY-like chemotaxis protein
MHAILLAEDESVSRRFLEDALDALGQRCESVMDGAQALDAARARRFDLLLLDLNLPELSGPEVLSQLRSSADAASRHAPAIALTADPEIDTRHRLLDAGFVAVGTKPIDVLALERLLAVALAVRPRIEPAGDAGSCWDDVAALRAAGGRNEIVSALRGLMRQELPKQRAAIVAACAAEQHDAARAELHRLRAACGFCGATQLAIAVEALQAALGEPGPPGARLDHFLATLDRLLIQDPP